MKSSKFKIRNPKSQRGAAAVLAMMFLVIFGSLAAAMAIVSQGNLATADSHLKVNRSLAAAETGMRVIGHELGKLALGDPNDAERYPGIRITEGEISPQLASQLWSQSDRIADRLVDAFPEAATIAADPEDGVAVVHIGPLGIAPNDHMTFTATVRPRPDDARYLRVRVVASDGPEHARIHRSISQDFRIDKRIPYAVLSRSRVMVGRNVMIEGPIGSRFTETHLEHGHPVHIVSDFHGLTPEFDELLEAFYGDLASNDHDGDNRLSLASELEMESISDPTEWDVTGDHHISEWDLFLKHFGNEVDGEYRVRKQDLVNAGVNEAIANELFDMIYTFRDPDRSFDSQSYLGPDDRYAKIQGEVYLDATREQWESGAAYGDYRDFLQGPIRPGHNKDALTFDAQNTNEIYEFDSSNFDVSWFRDQVSYAGSDVASQAYSQVSNHDPDNPNSPQPIRYVTEEVAFGSQHPYDFFERPVYENMTFENVKIPRGTNALFINCTFIGVTFVDSNTDNDDPNYNYAGMQEVDGTPRYPGLTATVDGQSIEDTKQHGNNLRFESSTFEGAVITETPDQFTHTRNKISFTGNTRFDIDNSVHLSESERALFRRSTILAPHYSVEMGTFTSPDDPNQYVELSGAIVGGIVDLRGNIRINGMIITTFDPQSGQHPVIGDTSPQFNTTLGYFGPDAGDLEGGFPTTGMGRIQVRYDPSIALPDGIYSPIQITPVVATYTEGGK
ncbi:hypothetical protein ACERK3_17610 [Phycisphaerales bacterium AB-hyl4]|uniref:Uncharacterized protein n=1 Tax=Natronomicrosphaera hydrolytica TaxID=3242702 RepID=A0ABV4U912_9BACT